MPLVLAGATSGSATLQATDAATVTLTLPATSGTLSVSGGSPTFATLTVTGDATISGLTVGKGGGNLGNNTATGNNALLSNTSGNQNSAFGQGALQTNTTGANNTALGFSALYINTTGGSNTAVGREALQANTTASNNTAVGYQAGYSANGDGGISTFGYQAGYNTQKTIDAFGYQAAYANTSGINNSAFGILSLGANTTGSYNVAVGRQALAANTTGGYNTAVGYGTGIANTTGQQNTFIGRNAGSAVTTGTLNMFIGDSSGQAVTTGGKNTIIGSYQGNSGGLDIRTASNYIVLSDGDGNPRYWIDNNGYAALNVGSTRGQFSIGFNGNSTNGMSILTTSSAVGESYVIFYNSGAVAAGSISHNGATTVSYNTSSDYRLKEKVAPMVGALDKVALLKPVTYTWKEDGKDGQGFIAHELQSVVPDCVTGAKDAVDAEGKPIYQGIDTSFLVATLTAAIQELNAKVEAQDQI